LKPQLSFTRQESLSQISEVSENVVEGIGSDNNHQNCTHSYSAAGFGMESWDNPNSIVFSGPPSKQARNGDGDIYSCFNGLETQVLKLFSEDLYVRKVMEIWITWCSLALKTHAFACPYHTPAFSGYLYTYKPRVIVSTYNYIVANIILKQIFILPRANWCTHMA
jgi:hypothetical protein